MSGTLQGSLYQRTTSVVEATPRLDKPPWKRIGIVFGSYYAVQSATRRLDFEVGVQVGCAICSKT